jgi:hypothetical protein
MLGKRVSAPVAVILEGDPALSPEMKYADYKESLYDPGKVILVPGEQPTRFHIRQLSDEHKDAIASSGNIRQQAKLAFRCSLQAVENYMVIDRNGVEVPISAPEFENAGKLGRIITEKWMSDANFPSEHLMKLYIVIDNFSEAQGPLSKSSAPHAGLIE